MVAANQADFYGEGIDPFTGLAPAADEDALAAARRNALRQSANRTANINEPGLEIRRSEREGQNYSVKDPDTWQDYALAGGILAAPALVTGAGALVGGAGALGFGAGTGSISAANAGLAASESAAASAPAIAGIGAETAPFLISSPYAAGAGSTAAGAAGSAGAAAPSLGSMIGADVSKYGLPVAAALAPTVINEVLGGRTKEQEALIAKQEQLAREAKVRQGQQQDARMNALGQQMLAFNPTNQMMAQMFGPGAAFTPDQMATMVQGQPPPAVDPSHINYQGTDPKVRAQIDEELRRQREFQAAEAGRRDMIMNGYQQPGPGPAPISMPAPQAARRF